MAWPTIIQRAHEENEFSLTFDTISPIPARELSILLRKIDDETRQAEGFVDEFIVELVEQKIGSEELRFRIVGPGRKNANISTDERVAIAAESSKTANWISAGATVVVAVVTALSSSIVNGDLNSTCDRILSKYGGSEIKITDQFDKPRVITKGEIKMGKRRRLRSPKRAHSYGDDERGGLLLALAARREEKVAGHFELRSATEGQFFSVRGNHYSIKISEQFQVFDRQLIVADVLVEDDLNGLSLRLVRASRLANF